MRKIDDQKIKSIIKHHQSDPKIQLTASEILHTYEVRQEHKKIFNKKKNWVLIPSTLTLAAAMTAAIVIIAQPNTTSSGTTDPSVLRQAEIPGGTEGEFVFMTASSLAFSDTDGLIEVFKLEEEKDVLKSNSNTSSSVTYSIEETLDYTMPLVETFTQASSGLDFTTDQGEFVGVYNIYQYQVQISAELYIYCNMTFEDADEEESETEIVGELHANENVYRVDGEKEVDLNDMETDLKINVHLSNTRKISIQSENEETEQKFSYSEYEDETLVSNVEIKAEVEDGQYSLQVDATRNANQYRFEVQVQNRETYYINTGDETIEVKVVGRHRYEYKHMMGPNK